MDAIDGEAMADLRWNHAPHNRDVAVAELKGNRLRVPKKLTTVVEKLYRSIEEVSGSQVIVDSSKFPSYAYILDRIPSIDLHCVHLVRDVRACTYSWTKEKTRRDVRRGARRTMRQFGSLRTSAKWSFQNVLVEQICRERPDHYTRVRYEDFCRDAPAEIRRVLCSVGEGERSLPMASDQSVELRGSHTVWGNPSRTRTGSIKIRLDDTWKTELGAITTAGVTALTWPLLLRYGYPLWT
jgi:hypothetical protein